MNTSEGLSVSRHASAPTQVNTLIEEDFKGLSVSRHASAPTQVNILIVEDCKTTRKVYAAYLKNSISLNFTVDYAKNRMEALEKLPKTHDFTYIVSDFHLGDGTGAEVAKAVRNISKETPFLLVTSLEEEDSEVQELQKHGIKHQKKPISKIQLFEFLNLPNPKVRKKKKHTSSPKVPAGDQAESMLSGTPENSVISFENDSSESEKSTNESSIFSGQSSPAGIAASSPNKESKKGLTTVY